MAESIDIPIEQAQKLGLISSQQASAMSGSGDAPPAGQRSVGELVGVPGSQIDTTNEVSDNSASPHRFDAPTREQDLEDSIRAGAMASSTPTGEARKNLALATQMGAAPSPEATKEVEQARKQDEVAYKLNQLPQLREWMLRSPYHASSVADEIDKWGTLDYVFGHPVTNLDERSHDPSHVQEVPGWVLSAGRAFYSTGTGITSMVLAAMGKPKSDAQVKAEHDVADQLVPGDLSPVLSRVNSIVGMTPIMAAALVHPAAAFGLMYAETAGRTYENLRGMGYDHETASWGAGTIGASVAYIGAAMGPAFKGSFLTKPTIGSLTGISNSFAVSMMEKPSAWRSLFGLGKNFIATMGMNIGMATAEAAQVEAFESASQGRKYDRSRVVSAGAEAANAWAEMAALSIVPAYKEHLERKALGPVRGAMVEQDERQVFAAKIFQNYEERGQALRSLHEASKLVAAVQAIQRSEFAKSNPDGARDLVSHMVAPRASQTVYVKPEIIEKMSPDALARLGNPDLSHGQAGGNVPVNIVDFILHPDAPAILPHTAGGPDLLTLREATGVDLTRPVVTGAGVPDEALDAWLAQERARRSRENAFGTNRVPTVEEIHSAVQGASQPDPLAARDRSGALPPTGERQPPPGAGAPSEPKRPVTTAPETPEGERALRAWAEDAVSRLPSSDLAASAEEHGTRHEEHTKLAFDAQTAATMHAEAGRSAETAKAQAEEAQRQAKISGAMHKASQKAVDEVTEIGERLARAASDPETKGQLSGRQRAWYAGEVYGQAFDAITEMLGLAKKRGYAASDLSDLYDKLARESKLPKDFDLEALDRMINPGPRLKDRGDVVPDQSKRGVGDLSLADLRQVDKAMTALAVAADADNSVRVKGIRVGIGMVEDGIRDHLKNIPDLPRSQRLTGDSKVALKQVEGNLEKVSTKTAGLKSVLNQPHTLMLKLGEVGESQYFDGFIAGQSREQRINQYLTEGREKILAGMPKELRDSGNDVVDGLTKDKDGQPVKRLRSDVWHLAMHLGTAGTDVKIANGMGVTPEALHEWLHMNLGRTIPDAHAVMSGVIEPHWKLFGRLWDEYEQHFKERGIAPPEKLQAQKLTVWGREFSGGYGGRLQWLDMQEGKPIPHPGSLESLLKGDATGPATFNGHLQERDPSSGGMPLLGWDGVAGSMRSEAHDIAFRPFIEDAHKIFSDSGVRNVIADKMGVDALKEIYDPRGNGTDWLHTVARGSVSDVHTAPIVTKAAMKLQGLAAYSAFSLNARVLLGQFSHLAAAMPGLGIMPDHMMMGARAAFNPDQRAWAHGQSEILRLRWADYEARAVELNRQMTGVEQGRGYGREAVDHLNWSAWREMDGFLSHAIWESAYNKARGTGRPDFWTADIGHEAAVREADIAVTKMMPAQDIYDQSAFVRDRSLAGFGFLVRNFPNTLANVAALNWWEARVSGKTLNKFGATAKFVGMVLAAEVLGKTILMQGKDPTEDSGESAVRSIFYPFMLSDPALATYHALQGETGKAQRDMERMLPPSIGVVAGGLEDLGRVVHDGDEEAGLRAGAHFLGLITRSPLPTVGFNATNALKNSEGPADALKKGMGYRQ